MPAWLAQARNGHSATPEHSIPLYVDLADMHIIAYDATGQLQIVLPTVQVHAMSIEELNYLGKHHVPEHGQYTIPLLRQAWGDGRALCAIAVWIEVCASLQQPLS